MWIACPSDISWEAVAFVLLFDSFLFSTGLAFLYFSKRWFVVAIVMMSIFLYHGISQLI